LHDYFPEAREPFFFPHDAAKPAQSYYGEDKVDENADTKRDEQKNAEAAKLAIRHDGLKTDGEPTEAQALFAREQRLVAERLVQPLRQQSAINTGT
jgi:hypothetical protein